MKTRYHTQVSFTVSRDVECNPPFVAGNRDSVWVASPSRKRADILALAKHILAKAYGLELVKPSIASNGFWT